MSGSMRDRTWFRFLFLGFAFVTGVSSAQYYSPAEQETLRNAKLPLLPNYFHNAAASGNVDMVRKFLQTDVRVDLRDSQGRTMLMLAVETSVLAKEPAEKRAAMIRGKIACARLLLERDADVRAKSKGGFTVLHNAAHLADFAQLMETFIEKGADVNAIDAQWGRTALFVAAGADDVDPMNVLLKRGADPNARDLKKWTPLLLAVLRKNAVTAARLVEAGADPTLKNDDGISPLEMATGFGDPGLIAALKKR